MAGKDNLKLIRTTEEAKAKGRNGGIASGKARARKKTANELVKILLKNHVQDEGDAVLKELGFSDKDRNNLALMIVAVFRKCIQQGDINAFNKLLEMAGENQTEADNGMLGDLFSDFKRVK